MGTARKKFVIPDDGDEKPNKQAITLWIDEDLKAKYLRIQDRTRRRKESYANHLVTLIESDIKEVEEP